MIEFDFHGLSQKELLQRCEENLARDLPEWEKEVYRLVQDWYAPTPYMQAHTSGSTGSPKPIELEKVRMKASARMTGKFLQLEPGNTALLCLPLEFIAGKMMLVRAMVLRMKILVVKPTASPLSALAAPIHFCAMVPNQVFASLEELEKVKTLLIGGGPVHKELADSLESKKGRIYHTYGMTETITHVAMRQINGGSSLGYFEALPGVSFRTDDRECLVINAPHVLEEELVTNDLVEVIDPHNFVWKGRYDHVIISGGVKIIPEEVEKKLGQAISRRFFVAGIGDPELGQRLVLIVEGPLSLKAEILRVLPQVDLPRFHQPKDIYMLPSFEETVSGKIKRSQTLQKAGLA